VKSIITWVGSAVLLGINLHALIALALVLTGRAKTATQQRSWAVRCAASALGVVMLSAVICGISIAVFSSSTGLDPSERATRLAMGISEALNCLGFAVVGSALPLFTALVCSLLASRVARRP